MNTVLKETDVEYHRTVYCVQSVLLDRFRNYRSLDLSLNAGFNVLAGPNAQGKTNLLEALYLLATTRLLRGQRDTEAIMEGEPKAQVSATLSEVGTTVSMTLERGARKKAYLNGLGLPRAADILGRMPCVCVSSVDMAIVRGEPADRRLFLDLELSGLYPAYLRHLSLYKRALEQRNALLKSAREWVPPDPVWEPWEEQLATHGTALRNARQAYIERLMPVTQQVHSQMGGGEQLGMTYLCKDETTDVDELRAMLVGNRSGDIARGSTTAGPHRDDLILDVQGREARLYGSQGQQRTSVIAVKMATLQLAKEELGSAPLLLLDDILSDLDETRRALLVEVVLERAGQAILTCTEASAAGNKILDRAQVFSVKGGTLCAVEA